MSAHVNAGYPEMTEHDPSLPTEILTREKSESLIEFVLELWAQNPRVAAALRLIEKKWTHVFELVDINVLSHICNSPFATAT